MPGETVVGVDRDRHSLGEAAQRCPDAHFTQADVTSAGWVSELVQFGRPRAVLSIETLEHLDTWGQDSLLAQAAESLEEGGVFVLACPIGDGPSANPWHKHEPTEAELRALLLRHFGEVLHFETDDYVSTSGPAVQAFCVCYAE
jgi:cyclopropane fatty-acyl-phospholipid synthase-like methyltransferase